MNCCLSERRGFEFGFEHSPSQDSDCGIKGKDKVLPITGHEGPEGKQMYSSTLPSTSALDGGWVVSTTPRPPYPGKDPVPIVQEAAWAPGPVWTGTRNLSPTGIRSPDRPARSESLYRLSYPGPWTVVYCNTYDILLISIVSV